MEYQGQTALITGASSGIGAGYAVALHRRGAKVVLVARRETQLRSIADTLNAQRPDSASVVVADLGRREGSASVWGVFELAEYIRKHRVDMLVNNAGRGSFGYFADQRIEDEVQMVELNVLAPIMLTSAVLPQMKERRAGAIVHVSSIAAFQPLPYMTTYAATKVFNYFFSMGLRYEARSFGIRVLAVCPGPTATEFGGVARVPGTVTGMFRDTVADVVEESLSSLARDRARVVTGWRSKFMALSSSVFPAPFTAAIVARLLAGVLRKSKEQP